ncbi:MAG TPA: hypothetical protein VF591_15695 [Pyrinomonadaceae bacterium]|jgi:hypothetical protein
MSTAYKPQAAASHNPPRVRPRELGIYELPDGRKFVASTLHRDGCALYPVRTWEAFGNAEYWLSKDGRILSRGIPTRWSILDLKDTGDTAKYPKPILH